MVGTRNREKRISQIAAGLNLQSMVDSAHRVFALAVNKNFTQVVNSNRL